MADRPSVFTVPPWGYRLSTPWLARLLGGEDTARGFLWVTAGCLIAAGPLLFLFLRRLGHGEGPALVAVLAYGLSPPVGETLRYLFLADPLSLVLFLALLLALEAGSGIAVVALLLALGALTKEVFLYLLPAVYLVRRDRDGDGRALVHAAAGGAVALGVTLGLRSWTAYLPPIEAPPADAGVFWLAVYRILAGFRDWWAAALLWGVTPLAVLGALRRGSRGYLLRYGYLLAFTLALPFAASVYTDDRASVPFFAQDIPRLLLLALPLLLPLALTAVDRLLPHVEPPPGPVSLPRWLAAAAALATAGVVAIPWLALDPYRRADLRGPRDGRLLLALCRQSLAFAHRLDRGKPIVYEPEARRFTPGRSDPHLLERMRWFLRDGWGPLPHYAMGPIVMQEREAFLVLPCLRPVDLDVILSLRAPREARLRATVNGTAIGEISAGPEAAKQTLRVPGTALFRGDNLLRLTAEEAGVGARLLDVSVRPATLPRAPGPLVHTKGIYSVRGL